MTKKLLLSRRALLRSGLCAAALSTVSLPLMSGLAFAQDGGTLRIAMVGGAVDSIDPHANQGQVIDMVRFTNLFDGLSEHNADASVNLVLAKSFTSNPEATEWTITLNEGVTFHDGTPFGAKDVLASIRRIKDPAVAAKGAALISFIDPDKIEIVDDLTLIIRLAQPYGLMPEIFANRYLRIVPAHFDAASPVGTGPYKLVSFTPGRESVFVKNDGYFRGPAKISTVVISDIADSSAQMNALRGGQIDIAFDLPIAEARLVETVPELSLLNNPTGMAIFFYMRTDKAPYNDPRLRKALRLIADRERILKIALAGYGEVGNDMSARVIAPCGTAEAPQRSQNIEEAKALLAEAGLSGVELTMTAVAGTTGMVESVQVFAEQAKAAGITIKVENLDVSTYLARYGEWDFGVDFLNDTYLPVVARSLLPGGTFNTSHWADDEFIDLYRQAVATPDVAARCEIIAKMRAIEYERGPNVLWGFANVLNAYHKRVQGLEPFAIDSALYHLRTLSLA